MYNATRITVDYYAKRRKRNFSPYDSRSSRNGSSSRNSSRNTGGTYNDEENDDDDEEDEDAPSPMLDIHLLPERCFHCQKQYVKGPTVSAFCSGECLATFSLIAEDARSQQDRKRLKYRLDTLKRKENRHVIIKDSASTPPEEEVSL